MADLDAIDRVRNAVTDRAELPGMTLMEHLTELRTRLIHSVIYLLIGFVVAYVFHERLYGLIQAPLDQLHIPLNFTHPTDGLNLYLKTAFVGGAILASPFILYQLWLFISPGMYANEKRYVWHFMSATIILFFSGAWFGYRWVLPNAIRVLIFDFGKRFHPIPSPSRTTPASFSPSSTRTRHLPLSSQFSSSSSRSSASWTQSS